MLKHNSELCIPRLINVIKALREQNFYLLEVAEVRITKKGLIHNRFQALDVACDWLTVFLF